MEEPVVVTTAARVMAATFLLRALSSPELADPSRGRPPASDPVVMFALMLDGDS